MSEPPNPAVAIGAAFGLRAEHLKDRIFDFYREPAYFHELETARPCVLIGGRGTGKTTVLKGLSYEGQARLSDDPVDAWRHYGVYLRFQTAQAAGFSGDDLPAERWQRLFGHFINLTLCEAALQFCVWFLARTEWERLLPQNKLLEVAEMLGQFDRPPPRDEQALLELVGTLRRRFQNYVNSVADGGPFAASTVGSGIDELLASLMNAPPMRGKLFFFLLDEFENLRPDQQEVVNTLIKHAGEHYTFKIGVKERGWRRKTVLGSVEQLQAPADYEPIDIRHRLENVFREYGTRICLDRLQAVEKELDIQALDLRALLPPLTEDDEAELLGIGELVAGIREELVREDAADDLLASFDAMPPLFAYLVGQWAAKEGQPLSTTIHDSIAHPTRWHTRYGNYKYALLFMLRRRKRGVRKHYAGLDTYLKLAATNIRFLMQLVEVALIDHYRKNVDVWAMCPVAPETQTAAAREVGQRNLGELSSLSLIGPRLARLCASLGTMFHQMADDPISHAPEVTQFHLADLPGDPSMDEDVALRGDGRGAHNPRELLGEAITHLALIALPSTKLSGAHVREFDYMVHPIFSPLFVYSYRKKRKIALQSSELSELVTKPRATVDAILKRNNRAPLEDLRDASEQMQLFDRYLRDEV